MLVDKDVGKMNDARDMGTACVAEPIGLHVSLLHRLCMFSNAICRVNIGDILAYE